MTLLNLQLLVILVAISLPTQARNTYSDLPDKRFWAYWRHNLCSTNTSTPDLSGMDILQVAKCSEDLALHTKYFNSLTLMTGDRPDLETCSLKLFASTACFKNQGLVQTIDDLSDYIKDTKIGYKCIELDQSVLAVELSCRDA